MAQQGPDVDIFGPDPAVVNQLTDKAGNLETFAQEFCNNLQVFKMDRIFTGPLTDLDNDQHFAELVRS